MRKSIVFLLVFIIVILLVPGITIAYGSTTKVVYVSSSTGDDSNNGSLDSPFRSIKKAVSSMPDTIYLKRGDVFYESIRYGRASMTGYGKGSLPIMSGYKRIIKPSWEKVQENIWKISLTDNNFTGYKIEGSSYLNNIGCIHEYDKDIIHGNRVEHFDQLRKDWDIWQCEGHSKSLPATAFDNLYLYLSSNPNNLKLEFSVNVCGANMYEGNMLINGIRFEGFNTAINFNMTGRIRNCRIDAIGGNIFLTDTYGFVCSGNGIQYWDGQYALDNSLVKGNYITRCYDCGITIQGNGPVSPKNIWITDNLITNCCQGWEDFIHHSEACYDNCVFENNIVVFSGDSGFGYPDSRFKYCHILQNNSYGPKGMMFKNNTFIGGNYYCSEPSQEAGYFSAVWQGNMCYIEEGRYLMGRYQGTYDIVQVPKKDGNSPKFKQENEQALAAYRSKTKDMTTMFIVVSDRRIKKLGKKAIKNFLKTHSY